MFNQDGTRKANTFTLLQGRKYVASRLLASGTAAARKYIEKAKKNNMTVAPDMRSSLTNLEARYVLYTRWGGKKYSFLEKASSESVSIAIRELKNVLGQGDGSKFLIKTSMNKEKCFNAETFSGGRELTIPTGYHYMLGKMKNYNRSIAILNYKEYAEPEYMCWHLDVMHKKGNETKSKKIWMFQTKNGELNVTGKTREDARRYMVNAVARVTVARLSGV